MSESTNNIENTGEMDERQLVVFRLGEEEFGVEISEVKEIVRLPGITPIPKSPDYVGGICNLRGNVLPVINTRSRFSMVPQDVTDHTRLLVVDTNGVQTGLIVDSVREVMRMSKSFEEPPPDVCKGIDREFLSGVVKVDEGKRLILKLNLDEILSVEQTDTADVKTDATSHTTFTDHKSDKEETVEEEQLLVSFTVAGDEYAFDIDKVREIIKLTQITVVPNVPEYVKGLLTIRNNLLPIVDLREFLGFPSLVSEHHVRIDKGEDEEEKWLENIRNVLNSGTHFTGILTAKLTSFGMWLENYSTSSIEVEAIIKRLKRSRAELYASATRVLELRETSKEDALSLFTEKTEPLFSLVINLMNKFKDVITDHISEDQRALVVESEQMTIGYLVDWINEVIRIPKSVIDETPVIASSDKKELKAVAKLEHGKRLIMIMDESALVSHETSQILSDIQEKEEKGTEVKAGYKRGKTLKQQSMDEEQLVTFSINKEEYGIEIRKVQEINRLEAITTVPRAPYFIDGMTNLRGEVIPVLNIRKLFGLEERKVDERTRIIIVDIKGNKTGLRVDQVNEVLRLARRDIVKIPNFVLSHGANTYMQGVCKLEDGKRIVVLLDVEKILDEKELRSLEKIVKGEEVEELQESPESQKDETPSPEKESSEVKKKKLEIAE